MTSFFRKIIPQWIINKFWHLPKAVWANIRFGFPSKKIRVIGVTGTDGKTTTVNMVYKVLKAGGKKVSMVSTINAVVGDESLETGYHVTSPDPMLVQKLIKQSVLQGSEIIVLEVTSHAIDQYRFWGINFEVGVVTNITPEHLDYHKTFENYFETKAKMIKSTKLAVLNREDANFEKLKKFAKGRVVTIGFSKNADFSPRRFPVNLKLPGEFNMLNALDAIAVGVYFKIASKIIKKSLEEIGQIEGRMQYVDNSIGLKIIIDFAHTPNGVKNALTTLKKSTKGKLIALVGAEGFRDPGKRAPIGEISKKLADYVIITAVDPRGLIDQINQQILTGTRMAGGKLNDNVFVENNRQKAIEMAINKLAQRGDTIAILGKGHEKSMNLDGKKEIGWSDLEAVKTALSEKNG